MKTILILDEVGEASMYNPVSYSDLLDPDDNVQIFLITNAASTQDKEQLTKVVEITHPTTNGLLEVVAFELHSFSPISEIYTKQEDLILRASHLREALKIKGLQPQEAILFRDKELMKSHLQKKGIRCPAFRRIYSPANILTFLKENGGYPIIVKPTLGSASAGVKVFRCDEELNTYLEQEFYENIDDKGKFDYNGELIVEKFISGVMYHINGFAKDGKIEHLWPFEYISTNLGFTLGKSYGNLSISKQLDGPLYESLRIETSRILAALPCPNFLVFHLEVFMTKDNQIFLCEIAARRPGGSIALLIDSFVGSMFSKLEFRWSNGLDISTYLQILQQDHTSLRVGDVMIPLHFGLLEFVPNKLPVRTSDDVNHKIAVIPISRPGTIYTGFDINRINTCVRLKFSTTSSNPREQILQFLQEKTEEVQTLIKYSPIGGVAH